MRKTWEVLRESIRKTNDSNERKTTIDVFCDLQKAFDCCSHLILFLIYINDLANCTSLFTLLFADDTSFLISSKNMNEVI